MLQFGNIAFGFPWAFALIALIVPLAYVAYKNARFGILLRPITRFRSTLLSRVLAYLPLILVSIILAGTSFILSRPTWIEETVETTTTGTDLVFLLDLSRSMLAEDMTPNRLETAKRVIDAFISRSAGGNVSLVIFSGKAFTLIPPTTDYGSFKKMLSNVTIYSIKQDVDPSLGGTAIGDGLLLASDVIERLQGDDKAIILVTDGEANVGFDPKIVGKYMSEKKTPVYSIGIGDPNGIELYTTDEHGNKLYDLDNGLPLRVSVDIKLLQYLAEVTHGKYYLAKNNKEIEDAFNELKKRTKKEYKTETKRYFLDASGPGWIITILTLSLFLVLSARRGESHNFS